MSTIQVGDRVYAHFWEFQTLWKSGTVETVSGLDDNQWATVRLDKPHARSVYQVTRLATALRPFDVVEMLADLAHEDAHGVEGVLRGRREEIRRVGRVAVP